MKEHATRGEHQNVEGAGGRFTSAWGQHAALFGSVARDEQRPDSDIDTLVDLDPDEAIAKALDVPANWLIWRWPTISRECIASTHSQ
jgi:hypothetical protein